MNLALTYLWKEWRAQRGLLIAYTLLVFTCLCIGLYLAPRHSWFDEGFGSHAVSWFVCAGGIGVVAFVVPALVRGEYVGPKGDQFVRRLPGALWPAFWGKLLFLVLAVVSLPLLGLLVGEVFVESLDQHWFGLYHWGWDGEVWMRLPWVVHALAAGLALVPWIWAVGTWTPGGRLALLGTILLVLVVSLPVFAVARQSPNLLEGFRWMGWAWLVPVVGLVVAALSWSKGRVGGGPLRSARIGLLTTGIALLPGTLWLAERAWRYHHPRLDRVQDLYVHGISPDGRYLLARVSECDEWAGVPMRIDLETGVGEQLGGIGTMHMSEVLAPFEFGMVGMQRYWRTWDEGEVHGVYDLVESRWTEAKYDYKTRHLEVPDELRKELTSERRSISLIRAPGNVRVWIDGTEIVFESPEGECTRKPWPVGKRVSTYGRGHAIVTVGERSQAYDLVSHEARDTSSCDEVFFVNGLCVARPRPRGRDVPPARWCVVEADGARRPLEDVWDVFGLYDDRFLLVGWRGDPGKQVQHVGLLDPATGEQVVWTKDPLPTLSATVLAPMNRFSSLLQRDSHGCLWMRLTLQRHYEVLRFAPDGTCMRVSEAPEHMHLISWRDLPTVLLQERSKIVELNIETGERKVLFGGKRPR